MFRVPNLIKKNTTEKNTTTGLKKAKLKAEY